MDARAIRYPRRPLRQGSGAVRHLRRARSRQGPRGDGPGLPARAARSSSSTTSGALRGSSRSGSGF
jgi:hypothetical protein